MQLGNYVHFSINHGEKNERNALTRRLTQHVDFASLNLIKMNEASKVH